MRIAATALCALLLACQIEDGRWPGGRPHAADGGAAAVPDAAAGEGDASPVCGGWRQVQLGLVDAELLETRPVNSDRSARIRIEHEQCPGDDPGQWSVGFTLENEFAVITPTVWRSAPDCARPEIATRVVTVKFLYPGSWKIQTASGTLTVPVGAPQGGACGSAPASACQRDCDCDGRDLCLSGDGVQRCAAPCEFNRDCGGDGRCGDGNGLTSVCRRALDECNDNLPCPTGFRCDAGSCQPTFHLAQDTRHSCECDADCESPLRCVAHFVGGEDQYWSKQCEVVCPSPSDAWCEGPHSCNPAASVEYADGVCAWVGE